ncbi:MAG: hypothetical protein IT280_02735 [Ignavibacteria bacterium]|nr:hypothetical protein [Ignavibacteria bacterium]
MLILSNFSFASQLMICEMYGDNCKCESPQNDHNDNRGIAFTQEKNNCCSEKITELSNTNTLIINNISHENEFLFSDYQSIYSEFNSNLQNTQNSKIKDYHFLPVIDIPLLNTSLLI